MLPLLLLAAAQYVGPLQLLPNDGSHVRQLIGQVLARSPRPLEGQLTQQEANDYARQFAKANPTCGLLNPNIKILPGNYVSVYAEVNLDQAAGCLPQWRSRLSRLPLRGRHTFLLDGRFQAEGGLLSVRVEKARLDGRYVAPALLNLGFRFLSLWKEGRYNFASGARMPFGVVRLWTKNSVLFLSAI